MEQLHTYPVSDIVSCFHSKCTLVHRLFGMFWFKHKRTMTKLTNEMTIESVHPMDLRKNYKNRHLIGQTYQLLPIFYRIFLLKYARWNLIGKNRFLQSDFFWIWEQIFLEQLCLDSDVNFILVVLLCLEGWDWRENWFFLFFLDFFLYSNDYLMIYSFLPICILSQRYPIQWVRTLLYWSSVPENREKLALWMSFSEEFQLTRRIIKNKHPPCRESQWTTILCSTTTFASCQ